MASLLRFLGITDKKSYHAWCLNNHPDKRSDDPDATRKFQEVSAAWRQFDLSPAKTKYRQPSPAGKRPRPKQPQSNHQQRYAQAYAEHVQKRCKQTEINGTECGWCYRNKSTGSGGYCFYHMPGTDHMKYADRGPSEMFGRLWALNKHNFFEAERTVNTCKAKRADGRWCTKVRSAGSDFCNVHNPDNRCGHPTKSGKPCTRPKSKGRDVCAQHA